jgi:tetratricopeptide (TPR) repeat protein
MGMLKKIERGFCNQMAAWSMLFRQRAMAMRWYSRMLELDPDDTLALASLGFQHAQAGEKRDALALFDRVVALKPDDADAHFNRGFLLQQMSDHEPAMAAFGAAITRNAAHDRAHYGLALSLIALRRHDEALPPLKKNTRLQPMSPYGWYQLARVQRELGHHKEAQTILDHLATFEPKVARQLERETGLKAQDR